MPLVVVREINCGRAVNYSSWVLKGLEHMLTPVRHASIRAQSVPMGPLSVRLERPQQYQWHGAQKKRLSACLVVRGKSKDAETDAEKRAKRKEEARRSC